MRRVYKSNTSKTELWGGSASTLVLSSSPKKTQKFKFDLNSNLFDYFFPTDNSRDIENDRKGHIASSLFLLP